MAHTALSQITSTVPANGDVNPYGVAVVLDSAGHAVETIAGGPIDGPWDLAAHDDGDVAVRFVTNVLNVLQ